MNNQWYYAHHPLMFFVCAVGIILVLIQATLILRRSLQCSKEIGMDQKQVNIGIRTAFFGSIGPALGVVGSIWALIVSLGAPITAFRLSVIGGSSYEAMAANVGAEAMGAKLDVMMRPDVFANALWTPALGVMGWLAFTFFFAHRMESVNDLLTGSRKALLPAVSVGAMLGAFAFFNIVNFKAVTSNPALTVSGVSGIIIMVLCQVFGNKIQWLKQWSLTIAMFGGAVLGVLLF